MKSTATRREVMTAAAAVPMAAIPGAASAIIPEDDRLDSLIECSNRDNVSLDLIEAITRDLSLKAHEQVLANVGALRELYHVWLQPRQPEAIQSRIAAVYEAEKAASEAYNRYERRAIPSSVSVPTVRHGESLAQTEAQIDEILNRQSFDAIFCSTEFDPPILTPEQIEAAEAYRANPPDAEALKAELRDRKDKRAAVREAEKVDHFADLQTEAEDALIAEPAVTVAEVLAKLKEDQRQSGSDAHPLYQSAINDLERLASVFATNAKEVTS